MSYKYLDLTGLSHFWDKIKAKIPTKTSQLTNDSHFSYSIEKPSGTIDDLAVFTSGKPGITGSISLVKKSSGVGSEIPAGWYNFYFSPHRTGSGGDNMNFGNIILTPMTFSGKSWILRRASNATTITEVKSVSTNEDLSLKTDTSVLPNDNGEIKTKYRISNKAHTGSNTTIWYYPLCKFPTDNNGNCASAIISGRIGGWVSSNMSYINALAWNRSGTGISLLDIAGSGNISNIWGTCDIVIYTDAETVSETTNDNGVDTVYLKCKEYFTFDLDLEMFQSTAEILYDGTYLTTEPTGTLVAQASTSTKRAELYNGKLYVAGKELANTDTVTSSKNGLMISTDKTKVDNIDRLLTSENLNNLLSTGTYYAGGGNTVSNKPTGVDAFGLKVFRTAAGFWTQELIEGNNNPGKRYTRQQANSTWSSWTEMKLTDTTYSSKAAASGGTDVSLVTTGEKYTWNNKQNALSSQTAYSAKGSATKVPQITTNSLGQVTGITEVTITQPTVNNGTLTIQKNGTNVQTFSANQSGNATANITVPTKTSDLTNDSGFITNEHVTDVRINGTSILGNKVANIITNTAYNATTNKIATMADVESGGGIGSSNNTIENVVSLTKAEYDALQTKETKTLYNITDDYDDNGPTAIPNSTFTINTGTLETNHSYKNGKAVNLNFTMKVNTTAGQTLVLLTLPSGLYPTNSAVACFASVNGILTNSWIRNQTGEICVVPASTLTNIEIKVITTYIV